MTDCKISVIITLRFKGNFQPHIKITKTVQERVMKRVRVFTFFALAILIVAGAVIGILYHSNTYRDRQVLK